ncbi:MAG: DUF4234 domain-containing protein [Candidatus Heimdallarchaeum aukensis]|uniref:DUF4234 domain-containing protein n=1 Tax=Candidatus Heimdallarchaeum aukensis TaxID=2876573 RepID=A0A9Y1BLR9_9ARCH|nr:MAG: DUF4234 domain-containing protein [Candidatus Heimdallarchaeum aukensis]
MIKERNPIVVIILMMITFGIYALFWYYWTKNELNELGADIPSYIFVFIPILNIYWMIKYIVGYGKATGKSAFALFLALVIFNPIGVYMIQSALNEHAK